MKGIFSCIYLGQTRSFVGYRGTNYDNIGDLEDFFFFCELRTSQFIISGEKGLNTHARIQTGSSGRSLFLSLFLSFVFVCFQEGKEGLIYF